MFGKRNWEKPPFSRLRIANCAPPLKNMEAADLPLKTPLTKRKNTLRAKWNAALLLVAVAMAGFVAVFFLPAITRLQQPPSTTHLNIQAVLELESMEDIVWTHIPPADQASLSFLPSFLPS